MDKSIKNILLIFLAVLIFYLLSVLSEILIPLVLAILLASIFQPLIHYFKKKHLPNWLILPVLAVITLAVLFVISMVVIQSVNEISDQQEYLLSQFNLKIQAFGKWLNSAGLEFLGMTLDTQFLYESLDQSVVTELAGKIAERVSTFTGSFIMFALYYVIILASMANYSHFLRYVTGKVKDDKLLQNYEVIQKSIVSYMNVKTFVSLLTALVTFLVCLIFGIKFAFIWAILTFLLNFIPNIGSTVAVIFPALMGVLQFDSIEPVIILALILGIVQFSIGNLLEPYLMGNSLRLNTLTVLFGLVFWGYLWGIPGMILSVPLLVIIKLIFEQNEDMAFFSRLMGYPDKNEIKEIEKEIAQNE